MASDATCGYPGYENFYYELETLLANHPPGFIYIHDLEAIRTTMRVTGTILDALSTTSNSPAIFYVQVDCVTSFTPRLLYENIINTLVGWEPRWEDGCANWKDDLDTRWNENMDSFVHGLRAAHAHLLRKACGDMDTGKGKGKAGDNSDVRLVIVIERPERLKETLPELLVPFTRLAELSRLDLSVIFISQVVWEDIKPPLGASPDPYYVDVLSPSKEDIVPNLILKFASFCENSPPSTPFNNPYQSSLTSLYTHFITTLCDVCYPFTHNPQELQYIAAARWPGFCKPLLDQYKASGDIDMESGEAFPPPTDDVRMRLTKTFNPTLTAALEALLPRLTNAADWALANAPPDDLLMLPRTQGVQPTGTQSGVPQGTALAALPRMGKFILVAAFLASTNPAKSDVRMFGRGLDERKRKRRATRATGKTRGGGPSKVAQRLLGPAPFTIDRMIAILGALLEENDFESRASGKQLKIPGEHTDMEIGRVGVFSCVMELTSMRLLHRTTPSDRLDGPPQFKCAVSYDATQALAKELKVALNDLLWDPL